MTHGDMLDNVLSALSDPVRRKLLDLIAEHGSISATQLAGSMKISRQGVVKHLDVLERSELVSSLRSGREVLFSIRADRLNATARWMDNLVRQWDRRLAIIKHIAESS